MIRFLQNLGLLLAAFVIAYFLGPRAPKAALSDVSATVSANLLQLEKEIADAERKAGVRPDNEARIFWADSLRRHKTPYSFVYLHGFSASWAEGDPVHRQLARHFGANLYVARLAGHGLQSPDALKNLTPAEYVASAEQALAIGKALGDKVVLIGTSAGGMLSLFLAARHPEISGLVLYSPCIEVANPALKLVTGPWGRQILRQVNGSDYLSTTRYKPDRARYWYAQYHANGLVTLQTLLDAYMTDETFEKINQPVFLGYYYKDDEHQDKVVSVAAMLEMYEGLGTKSGNKRKVAFPEAGEHVIASHFTSGDLNGVYRESERFLSEVLQLQPVQQPLASLALQKKK